MSFIATCPLCSALINNMQKYAITNTMFFIETCPICYAKNKIMGRTNTM